MTTIRYAPHIDGLRAIAVLSVMLYHLNPAWLPGGFAGVDVFFVISGFIVSASIGDARPKSFARFMAFFYARRIARIVPALAVFLLTVFVFVVLLIPSAWISKSIDQTGLYAFFGLSNFILANSGDTYFSPLAEFNPFTHTWSLGVEEQFYLLFPFLFAPWVFAHRRLSIGLFFLAAVTSFVALALRDEPPAANYYFSWFRLWELGAGVLLYQGLALAGISFSSAATNRRFARIGAVVCLVMLAWGVYFANPDLAPYPSVIPAIIGTLGLLAFLQSRNFGAANALLTVRPMRYVGRISYSLYLWHWSVYVFFRWTVGLDSAIVMLTAVVLTFILSDLSFRWVETPFRKIAGRAHQALIIGVGLVMLVSAYGCAHYLINHRQSLSLSTVVQHDVMWYPDRNAIDDGAYDCAVRFEEKMQGYGQLWVYSRNSDCQRPRSFNRDIYVIGDSHAMHYRRMFSRIALETGATVYAFNNAGCPFLDFLASKERDARCNKPVSAGLKALTDSVRAGDVVFLGSLRVPRMIDQWAYLQGYDALVSELYSTPQQQARRELEDKAIATLKPLAEKNARLVFVAQTPTFNTVPFRCADWFNRRNPICAFGGEMPREDLLRLRQPSMDSIRVVSAKTPHTELWDPFPVLCPPEWSHCKIAKDNMPLFFDGDHISGHSNDLLYPSFVQQVLNLAPK